MAQTPSGSHDPKRKAPQKNDLTQTPKPKMPSSFGDSDWLAEIPEAPPLPDQSGSMPAFVDSAFDIQTLFPGTAPTTDAESEDVDFGPLPTPDPLNPASGWLDSVVLKSPSAKVPMPEPSDSSTDIFSDQFRSSGLSELLSQKPEPTPSPTGSNIFDEPANGSRRFSRPQEKTEEINNLLNQGPDSTVTPEGDDLFLAFDQPPSELFADETSPSESLSKILDDGSTQVNAILDELNLNFPTPAGKKPTTIQQGADSDSGSALNFNIPGHGSSSSHLFTSDSETDELLAALSNHGEEGEDPDSNIFSGSGKDPSSLHLDQPTMRAPDQEDVVEPEFEDGREEESIFDQGPKKGTSKRIPKPEDSSVDFNLPRNQRNAATNNDLADLAGEGAIDWTMPSSTEHSSASGRHEFSQPSHTSDRLSAFDLDVDADDVTNKLSDSAIFAAKQSPSKIFPRPSVSVLSAGSRTSLEGPRSGINPAPAPKMGGSGIFELNSAHTVNLDEQESSGYARSNTSKLGWFAGTAAGLLAGVGLSGAAYIAFLDKPTTTGKSVVGSPSAIVSPAEKTDISDARKFLLAGDPERALPALEGAGDNAPTLILAERGKARWLVRVRELAAERKTATADDPLLTQAVADLQQIVDKADTLNSPEEKRAAVEAALRIGLTKELSGDTAGALIHYANASKKFPESKFIFDASVRRIKALPAPKSTKTALLPQQADEIAQLVLPALLLIQADAAGQENPQAEAGFLFWDAINEASVNNFTKARTLILRSREVHNERRLALAGRGLNPLSDPMEQIFIRCCNDLNAFWTVKEQLYNHPTAGPVFAKAGLNKITAAIDEITAPKADASMAKTLEATKAKHAEEMKIAEARTKQLSEELAKLEANSKATLQELETAKKSLGETSRTMTAMNGKLEERTKQAEVAAAEAEQAKKSLATANEGLDKVVVALKAGKLVDESADTATLLKTLPEVLKKLSTATESTDAKKAAEALTAAKKDLDAAKATLAVKEKAATDAQQMLADAKAEQATKLAEAKAEAEKVIAMTKAEAMKTVEAVKAEGMKAIEAAKNESAELRANIAQEVKKATLATEQAAAKKIADAEATMTKQLSQLQDQLQAANKRTEMLEAEYRKQLADARAGVVVPLTGAETFARDRASTLYSSAVDAYFANRFMDATAALTTAVELHPGDARYWYFLGLAQYAMGNPAATESFRRGAEQEGRNQPDGRSINSALERIQGNARATLKQYRP